MSILYDILVVDDLKNIDDQQKLEFFYEIINTGNYDYFNKFKTLLSGELQDLIPANKVLELLPMIIDVKLFEFFLNHYEFKQGQHFFFNYAKNNKSIEIKKLVYDYFVDIFSHVIFDNMEMYEELLID